MGQFVAGKFSIARLDAGKPTKLAEPPYHVGAATVRITEDGRYLVSEPPLSREAERIWGRLMDNLYYSYAGGPGTDAVQPVREALEREARQTAVLDVYARERAAIEYYLVRDIAGYREIDVLMRDPLIEDVICTRFDREAAVIHRGYLEKEMLKTNVRFPTQEAFDGLLQIMSQREGRAPTTSKPISCYSTAGNDRVTITWRGEVSRPGSTLAVRRFPKEPYSITHLLESGALSPLMAAYVWVMNDARSFSFVVGETGSGKTTAINALACLSNPRWHVLTIEEVRELTIPHFWNEYLVTRESPHLARSEYDVDIMGLGMAALRKKPHYVIVGEVRGREAQQLFQIALTGHGCVSSVHAHGPQDLLARLGGAEMGVGPSQQAATSYMLHVQKVRGDGGRVSRKVTSLTEVVPGGDGPELRTLFSYDPESGSFTPSDPKKAIAASARLGRAVRFLGIPDIEADIWRRAALLRECMNRRARGIGDVFGIVSRYYGVSDPGAA